MPVEASPVWAHLVGLLLVPAVVIGVLLTADIHRTADEVAHAGAAQEAVEASIAVAAVSSAVDQEILRTLVLGSTRTPELLQAFGLPLTTDASSLGFTRDAVDEARDRTDRALAATAAYPSLAEATATTEQGVLGIRAVADDPAPQLADLGEVYRRSIDLLQGLTTSRQEARQAVAATELSSRTRSAVHDAAIGATLLQASSRESSVFLAARYASVFAAAGVTSTVADWDLVRRQNDIAVGEVPEVDDPGVRSALQGVLDGPASQAIAAVIAAPADQPLSMLSLISVVRNGSDRAAALADVVERAGDRARALVGADRAAAEAALRTSIVLAVVGLLSALVACSLLARTISRALRRVEAQARKISQGQMVDVRATGPREVRTIATALDDTVAGLRRIRDQAAAVARGDLDDEVLREALPGPLGEVVHASVQQILTSMQQRDALRSELVHQAAHDPLTDLPNRAAARQLITAALHRARRAGAAVGVLYIDLDSFKAVNDRWGHAGGDQVLRAVATRLSDGVRSGDVVCRLGGDEFVALIDPVEDDHALIHLAERLVATVAEPVTVSTPTGATVEVVIGASIGVAVSLDGETDGEALTARADAAAYLAKDNGRGRVEFFDDDLRTRIAVRRDTENALRGALATGGLRMVYQPVVDVATGELRGYEALVRWTRDGVAVPPDAFIPVAEESDLITELDCWVLAQACGQLAAWRRAHPTPAGRRGPTMAVNLSGRHLLDPRVVEHVSTALEDAGVPPTLLVLEVTETVLVDSPVALDSLVRLRAMGIEIAIDDFGTGYTSIGQLGLMPVNTLKIDRSFVASDDPAQRALVTLMIRTAHTLGMSVVAEGVEEQHQLTGLQDDSCDLAQGYLMARPLEADAAGHLYRTDHGEVGAGVVAGD